MRRFTFAITSIFLVSLSLNIFISSAQAYYTNMPASVVIGQPDFTSGSANQGGSVATNTLSYPLDSDVCNNKLIVPDVGNNRVLIFNSIPTTNNASADVVIGQPDFTSNSANQGGSPAANTMSFPQSIACVDNKLLVSDKANNRVLIFNSIPTTNNASADVVIGQPDFTSNSANQGGSCAANTLRPLGDLIISTYGERLFISDGNNQRVLIFNSIPTTNNASADVVVGQPDFTTCGSDVTQNKFYRPRQAVSDGKRLYVSEQGGSRVLIFNTIPTANGASADVVIGQPDFTSSSCIQDPNSTAQTLCATKGIEVANGRILIGDQMSSRFLVFNSIPTTNNASADVVIGQPDMTTGIPHGYDLQSRGYSASASGISYANFANIHDNKLIIGDMYNHRILIFEDISSTPGLTLHSPENISEGKVKISGTVIQGEYGKYALQRLQASVNAGGFDPVTHLDGGRQQGNSDTIYEFYHEFEPWTNFKPRDQWTQGLGYTIKIKAISYNAEDDYAFHFSPFTLESVNQEESQPYFNFLVPLDHIQTIKNNISSFEVYLDNQKYLTNISPDNINAETGRVYISINTNNITSEPINLPNGEHEVKIVAVDNWGYSFESNSLTINFENPIYSSGGSLTNSSWFPLQINSISGVNTGIISSFNPSSLKSSYTTTNLNPVVKGIAFAGAQVTLTVTNQNNSEDSKNYSATVSPDSTFSLNPTLYPNSLLTISVRDILGNFTQLHSFSISSI